MPKYLVTLEIDSDTDPREWYLPDTLVIDEDYRLVKVEDVNA